MILFCLFICVYSSSLKQVWLITRHGDRSPTENYPKLHPWEDLGELTGEGMNQLYRLGDKMRSKYISELGFIPRNYSNKSLYVRSTDKDRTLMSAQSFLLGLYPLGTGPDGVIDSEDIPRPYNFQPVPIHSENVKNDLLLHAYKNCPPLKELLAARKTTTEWKQKEAETEVFRQSIALKLGMDIIPLSEMSGVYHALKAEKVHKHKDLILLGFTDEDERIIEKLKNFVLARKYYTRRTGQIGAGILLNHIVEQMEISSNMSVISPKFIYYSGHDGTLLSLFSAMGFVPDSIDIPHYASYMIFELHDYNGVPYVRVEYNGKNIAPNYHNITLSDFKREMKPGFFTELEFRSFCQESLQLSVPTSEHLLHSLLYFSPIVLFLLGYFISKQMPAKTKIQ